MKNIFLVLMMLSMGVCISNPSMAAEETAQILVQTDSDTISVYNAEDGKLECELPGRLAETTGSVLLKDGCGMAVCNDKTSEFQLYLFGEAELRPEKYEHLRFLTDTLYTDSDADLYTPGDLYKVPDTKLSSRQGCFQRAGDYIFTEDSIYDLEGSLLGTHPAFTAIYERYGDDVLGCDLYSNTYVMYDCSSLETLWTEDQMDYEAAAEKTISWITESGEGLITDWKHTEIISEADWKNQNADWEIGGNGLALISEKEETGESIVRLKENNRMHYYICDDQMNIVEDLSEAKIAICSSDGLRVPLKWSTSEEGVLTLENLWTEESIEIPLDPGFSEVTDIAVTKAGDVYGISVTAKSDGSAGIIVANGKVLLGPTENVLSETVTALDAKTIKIYENGPSPRAIYLDQDGNALAEEDQEVVYADQDRICVRDGEGVSILPRK